MSTHVSSSIHTEPDTKFGARAYESAVGQPWATISIDYSNHLFFTDVGTLDRFIAIATEARHELRKVIREG